MRDMLYKRPEIAELFTDATMHVLDYEMEFDTGFPDPEKFPEFQNSTFSKRFHLMGKKHSLFFLGKRVL